MRPDIRDGLYYVRAVDNVCARGSTGWSVAFWPVSCQTTCIHTLRLITIILLWASSQTQLRSWPKGIWLLSTVATLFCVVLIRAILCWSLQIIYSKVPFTGSLSHTLFDQIFEIRYSNFFHIYVDSVVKFWNIFVERIYALKM